MRPPTAAIRSRVTCSARPPVDEPERAEAQPQRLLAEQHVGDGVEVVAQREVLVHGLDAVLARRRRAEAHRLAADADLAGVRRVQAAEDLDERALAGAVVADEADDLAGVRRACSTPRSAWTPPNHLTTPRHSTTGAGVTARRTSTCAPRRTPTPLHQRTSLIDWPGRQLHVAVLHEGLVVVGAAAPTRRSGRRRSRGTRRRPPWCAAGGRRPRASAGSARRSRTASASRISSTALISNSAPQFACTSEPPAGDQVLRLRLRVGHPDEERRRVVLARLGGRLDGALAADGVERQDHVDVGVGCEQVGRRPSRRPRADRRR